LGRLCTASALAVENARYVTRPSRKSVLMERPTAEFGTPTIASRTCISAITDGGDFLSFARVGLNAPRMLDPGPFGCMALAYPMASPPVARFPTSR